MSNTLRKPKKKRFLQALEPYLFCLPLIFCLFGLFTCPMIRAVIISFQKYKLTQLHKVRFIKWDNYINVFDDPNLSMITVNTIKYVIIVVGLQFILGFGLALALRRPFKGRNICFYLCRISSAVILNFNKGIVARSLHCCKLFSSQTGHLRNVLLGRLIFNYIFSHLYHLILRFPLSISQEP